MGLRIRWILAIFGVIALLLGTGLLAACSTIDDAISFVEYIEATGDVLDANEIDANTDINCEGSTDTKTVTCTAETSDGQRVESRGENLGEDSATLIVIVGGETLYDGLLDDAPGA